MAHCSDDGKVSQGRTRFSIGYAGLGQDRTTNRHISHAGVQSQV